MTEIPIHLDSEPTRPQELRWWGVTLGSMAFVARDTDAQGAVDQAYAAIGIPRDEEHKTYTVWAPFDEEKGEQLSADFGVSQGAYRVEPFTYTPWDPEASPQRIEAARKVSASRLSNY